MSDEDDREPVGDAEGDSDEPGPIPGDAAEDPTARRRRETRAKFEQRQAEEFWAQVFALEVGRREMWRIFQTAGVFEERFAVGPNGFPQPEATWFRAGEQSFGHRLYLECSQVAREGVLKMHDEHDHRRRFPLPRRRR